MEKDGIVWYEDSADLVGDLTHQLMEGFARLRGAWQDAAVAQTDWPADPHVLAVLASVGHLLAVHDAIVEAAAEGRETP